MGRRQCKVLKYGMLSTLVAKHEMQRPRGIRTAGPMDCTEQSLIPFKECQMATGKFARLVRLAPLMLALLGGPGAAQTSSTGAVVQSTVMLQTPAGPLPVEVFRLDVAEPLSALVVAPSKCGKRAEVALTATSLAKQRFFVLVPSNGDLCGRFEQLRGVLGDVLALAPEAARLLHSLGSNAEVDASGGANTYMEVELSELDFQLLYAKPEANGMQLFFAGKLKVNGNQMLAMKLQSLFSTQ